MSDKERTAPSGSKDPVKPIQGVDIGSDGKENESDRKIREFTLAELEKSKKILPKERYEALVKAVGEILRGHYEKEEEVREGVRAKIAEFKGEVGVGNSIDENESCIRNKFDVADINGVKTAVFLKSVFSDPKKLQEFRVLLEKDTDLLAGFIRYWSMQNIDGAITDKSNLKRIML